MLEWLRQTGKASDRRLRLFGCACVRRVWHLLVDERSRRAVEVAEDYADGLASAAELAESDASAMAAGRASLADYGHLPRGLSADEFHDALASVHALFAAGHAAQEARSSFEVGAMLFHSWAAGKLALLKAAPENQGVESDVSKAAERGRQADIVRDIFGNPFVAPPRIESAWRTPEVVELAKGIYERRSFDRMPELGMALEKAGCSDRQVLDHCRSAGEHARGCWVVDLILGKE
jgi:hypothetical protein